MSYPTGEGYVLTQLQAIAGSVWTSTNTARGNWGILNSGRANHYAVLHEGAGQNDFLTISTSVRTYQTVIQIWMSYTDDGTSATNLQAYGEDIRDKFDARRLLGDTSGTIQDARCVRWDEVEEMWNEGGGPRWLRQKFYVQWKEENNVTFAE